MGRHNLYMCFDTVLYLFERDGIEEIIPGIILDFICGFLFILRQDVTILFQKMFDFNFGKTCNLV